MKWGKVLAVVFGAVVITALGIDAADTISGSRSTLLGQLVSSQTGACPSGMVLLQTVDSTVCIDQFEASAGEDCEIKEPSTVEQTAINILDKDCSPASVAGKSPWTYVLRHQAQSLCAKAGKQLVDSETWYRAALGTPADESSCNSADVISKTGSYESCISGIGVQDMIGNVWEHVDLSIENGLFSDGREVAEEGYVYELYVDGLPRVTTSTPQSVYNKDYFWSDQKGSFVLVRGGFFGSKSDAGIYSAHAAIGQNFSSQAIGFRCALRL